MAEQQEQEREDLLLLIAYSGTDGVTLPELMRRTHLDEGTVLARLYRLARDGRVYSVYGGGNPVTYVACGQGYRPPSFDGRQLALPFESVT